MCLRFPGTTLDNTFGDNVNVHRIGNKMFALVHTGGGEIVTLKATPEDAVALVSEHDSVRLGLVAVSGSATSGVRVGYFAESGCAVSGVCRARTAKSVSA